jgi:hypothetical protein
MIIARMSMMGVMNPYTRNQLDILVAGPVGEPNHQGQDRSSKGAQCPKSDFSHFGDDYSYSFQLFSLLLQWIILRMFAGRFGMNGNTFLFCSLRDFLTYNHIISKMLAINLNNAHIIFGAFLD